MLLRIALALISKQAHDRSCCKNSPVQSEWQRSIYGNGLYAYRPTAALIGYGALVCVEYGPESCQSMQ